MDAKRLSAVTLREWTCYGEERRLLPGELTLAIYSQDFSDIPPEFSEKVEELKDKAN